MEASARPYLRQFLWKPFCDGNNVFDDVLNLHPSVTDADGTEI